MKKTFVSALSELLGLALGIYNAITGSYSGWNFAREIVIGAFLGYVIGLALSWKDYKALFWGFITLLLALALELIAGSSKVSVLENLIYASMGIFIALDVQYFRKQTLIGGILGGTIGFMLGLMKSQYYGYANVLPGLFNALLSSTRLLIFGMFFGSICMALFSSFQGNENSD
ncbi:MAG: hypothetical protein ABI904_16360 [Chloroflexota bacterium]